MTSPALFSGRVGDVFKIERDASQPLEVSLVEVRDLSNPNNQASPILMPDARTDPFSLLFRGPSDHALTQGIYRFNHRRIGQMDLFIVPVAGTADGIFYEAVFN